MARRYHDAEWLEQKYHEEGLTQREIAELCGVSPSAIRKWMDRNDIETRAVRGENHGLYGESRDAETKRKISKTLEGRELDAKWRERIAESHSGKTTPVDVRERISDSLRGLDRSESTRRKMSESSSGEQNPRWKGGTADRHGAGWQLAREEVTERDGVCQHCGHDGMERQLEVHHIVPLRKFHQCPDAELSDAHELTNLVFLCTRCHRRADHGELEFKSGIDDPTA